MTRGSWDIEIPATGHEVVPELLIVPVLGFDPGCYRLGYGGGFYDATLAARVPRPQALGVAYASAALPTIFPQPHDVPLDAIVTPEAVHRPAAPPP
jgi:5,10-methenyltetrahydrofolate synthetase